MSSIRELFSTADLDRLRDSARRAELRTSGEIVAYLVNRVDDHDEAAWRGAALGALAAATLAGFGHWLSGLWGVPAFVWITLPTFVGATAGYLLATYAPAVERRLIRETSLEERVRHRAEAAFLDEEIFATRERTGILVFVALFEHRALILADSGIHEKVGQETWEELVAELVDGIRAGRTVEALDTTLGRCGDLLEEHGVARQTDDVNELADEPRLRER